MTGAAALTPEQQALAAVLQAFQSGMAPQVGGPAQASDHKRKRDQQRGTPATTAQPLLAPVYNEPLLSYFTRLAPLAAEQQQLTLVERDQPLTNDGIYLHKRPVMSSGGGPGALLALAGTLMHHVVLYIKAGSLLHKLEYGPHDGSDITSDLALSVPCHPCLTLNASIPEEDRLPLLYLGPCAQPLDSPAVQQAIKFAESRQYNAVRNNCVHVADFMGRVLTDGRLVSAPLVYDALAGGLPAQEPAMLAMMPLVMGCTWFQAVDGSQLYAQFLTQGKAEAEGVVPASGLAHSSSTESLPLKRQETAEKDATDSGEVPGVLDARLEASNNAAGLGEQDVVEEGQQVGE